MGGAFLSTGAMVPSTLQYAGAPLASACHCGAFRFTADTGSPMALTGISEPSFAAVQPASAIVFAAEAGWVPACWLWTTNTAHSVTIAANTIRYRFMQYT